MKILIVAATAFEIAPLLEHLDKHHSKSSFFEYQMGPHQIFPLVTGVGAMMTAFGLSRFSRIKEIDLAINLGLCGALDTELKIKEIINIHQDRFSDLGIEEKDGSFTDIYEMQLADGNRYPYSNDGWILNEQKKYPTALKSVSGLTVNKVHGKEDSITSIKNKYKAQVESMEGAAFLYACHSMDVEALQIRSVSNYVEPRNKDNWDIPGALNALNAFIVTFLESLKEPEKPTIGFKI